MSSENMAEKYRTWKEARTKFNPFNGLYDSPERIISQSTPYSRGIPYSRNLTGTDYEEDKRKRIDTITLTSENTDVKNKPQGEIYLG